jgi:hypothetical protein
MSDVLWLLAAAAFGGLVASAGGLWWFRLRRSARASGLSFQLLQRAREMGLAGRSLEAVRLLQTQGRRSLREATEMVESLLPPQAPAPAPDDIPPSPAVARLLSQRRFLEALRAYQDQTGLDAEQARDAMERIRNGIN